MITFEISKWVLVATICGIMLLGALIELLVACIYSNRDNAKKACTDENSDKITQLENEIKLYSDAISWLRENGRIDILQEKYNSLAKKYEDVLKNQIVTEKRINQLTSALDRFEAGTYEREKGLADDFHDLEEHVHHWLNSKPHRKDKDPAIKFYNRDCCVPTIYEAMRIIKNLREKCARQGYITIADYRQEFGLDCTFTQEDYGWHELDFSAVYAHSLFDGYEVIMPKPAALIHDYVEISPGQWTRFEKETKKEDEE